MRVLLDACVLYPTVMREILLGVAEKGAFVPLWSERILEEWTRAVARKIPDQEGVARAEIALLKARWPRAVVLEDAELEAEIYLPDPDDRHVLAAAVTGRAQVLMTLNLKDFPTRIVSGRGIIRRDPDGFLREVYAGNPEMVGRICEAVRETAELLSGEPQPLRALLKKARLPRLAKACTTNP